MQSFGFQIVINCALAEVFAIYTDIERWRNRSVFGDIRWVQGTPWEEGSRLRIETRVPVPSVVDQVVQHFEANRSVSYLSHVFGITCETRVVFVAVSEQQTAVNVRMQLVGTTSRVLGFAVEPAIAKATRSFFDELQKECEGASGATSAS
jgi:polyketide cyclase/dehydrase/lipid transport protein